MSVHMLVNFPFEAQAGNGGTTVLLKNVHIEALSEEKALLQLEGIVEEYYLKQIKDRAGKIIYGFSPDDETRKVSLTPLGDQYKVLISVSVGFEKKAKKIKKEPA